jgi:hypothetical protein
MRWNAQLLILGRCAVVEDLTSPSVPSSRQNRGRCTADGPSVQNSRNGPSWLALDKGSDESLP